MCGIAGFLKQRSDLPDVELAAIATRMSDTLVYRGPDDAGTWVQADAGIAFGHRRLSILDLSPLGKQPMGSNSGRYHITYNGEVYNHPSLRAELIRLGHRFRGTSDTETMLACFDEWGVVESVRRFVGMFAFAVWDARDRELVLVRDRIGIKPLYFGWVAGDFVFASELKAIRAFPTFAPTINRSALTLFLEHSYVPAPFSIYDGIEKLSPGTVLKVRSQSQQLTSYHFTYWSMADVARSGEQLPFSGSDSEATDELQKCLRDAVRLRMLADVPVGAFLSGGVDSSTTVALMQAESSRPVKTFCIGFEDPKFDEAPFARAVARHLGTDHTEHYISSQGARDVIPQLPQMFDEPFADSSQIPTWLVSQIARREVTVSLSGDGGDELFCGYNRYALTKKVWGKLSMIPLPVRRGLASAVRALTPQEPRNRWLRQAATMADLLATPDLAALYLRLHSHWKSANRVVLGGQLPMTNMRDRRHWTVRKDLLEQLAYIDSVSYLPDDILTKVDRASMAVSLEARVPILDHRVVEFAWRVPSSMKVRDGQTKWLLRRVLDRFVPRQLVERPKVGFGVPLADWLRGPLRDWSESLLSEDRLNREGYLQPTPIRQRWQEHLNGSRDWCYELWDVLMFQAWQEGVGTAHSFTNP